MSLRNDVMKLAQTTPELRRALVPVLKRTAIQKQGNIENLVGGQIKQFNDQMKRFAHGLKSKILAVLQKTEPSDWKVEVSFFFDDWYSLRVQVKDLNAQGGWPNMASEEAIAHVLGVSPSQLESAQNIGAFPLGGRSGYSYEFGIQMFPGVASTD